MPELAVRIDLAAPLGRESHGQMDEGAMPAPDEHRGLAGHRGVDGVLGELRAVDVVLRIGRHAADDVARVEILEVALGTALLEECADLLAQEEADIAVLLVAAGIGRARPGKEILARAFRDDDDGALLFRQR